MRIIKKHSKGIELTSREVTICRPIHTGGRNAN